MAVALTRTEIDLMTACAIVELAAALAEHDALPAEYPAINQVRSFVAAADAGAFGDYKNQLPAPPRGGALLDPPPGFTPEEIAVARQRTKARSRPSWARRRRKGPDVIDLAAADRRAAA